MSCVYDKRLSQRHKDTEVVNGAGAGIVRCAVNARRNLGPGLPKADSEAVRMRELERKPDFSVPPVRQHRQRKPMN